MREKYHAKMRAKKEGTQIEIGTTPLKTDEFYC